MTSAFFASFHYKKLYFLEIVCNFLDHNTVPKIKINVQQLLIFIKNKARTLDKKAFFET